MYQLFLSLRKKRCLVVGGGGVALRKVEGLLGEEARVTIIAKDVIPALAVLAKKQEILLEQRAYCAGDASQFSLVFAATNDRQVNRQVSLDCEKIGIWVNVVDDPELCSFYLPARVNRGALQLAVASSGGAPFAVRRIRQLLERRLGPEWGEWIDAAARFRKSVRNKGLSVEERERCYEQFFQSTVDGERLTARVPSEEEMSTWQKALALISGDPTLPIQEGVSASPPGEQRGFVSLVGGGPGDAGLLTVRGFQRLLRAQAVVYDHLAATVLPGHLGKEVELHCVGKRAGFHPVP